MMTYSLRSLLRRGWYGFVSLFGLNACPTPPPGHAETPGQRQVRERLEQRLRGESEPPPRSSPPRSA